jgi:hypothetical protein
MNRPDHRIPIRRRAALAGLGYEDVGKDLAIALPSAMRATAPSRNEQTLSLPSVQSRVLGVAVVVELAQNRQRGYMRERFAFIFQR